MLGSYLKKYRMKNNLSQTQMADKLKTSQSYYCQLEKGSKTPGFSMVNRISKLLKVDVSFIRELL